MQEHIPGCVPFVSLAGQTGHLTTNFIERTGLIAVLGVPSTWRIPFSEFVEPVLQTIILLRMMYYSNSGTGITSHLLLSGIKPKTFRLLVRMLYTELQETHGS